MIFRVINFTKKIAAMRDTEGNWTFFSNHAHVLVCLLRTPEATLREVADQVGITERAVQRIVAELEEGGVLERSKAGRRNTYRLFLDQPLKHPLEARHTIREVLGLVVEDADP